VLCPLPCFKAILKAAADLAAARRHLRGFGFRGGSLVPGTTTVFHHGLLVVSESLLGAGGARGQASARGPRESLGVADDGV